MIGRGREIWSQGPSGLAFVLVPRGSITIGARESDHLSWKNGSLASTRDEPVSLFAGALPPRLCFLVRANLSCSPLVTVMRRQLRRPTSPSRRVPLPIARSEASRPGSKLAHRTPGRPL